MQNPDRFNFMKTANTQTAYQRPPEMSKSDKMREIEMSKVNNTNTLDKMFEQAIENQMKRKELARKAEEGDPIEARPPSDDMFGDLDKELGF